MIHNCCVENIIRLQLMLGAAKETIFFLILQVFLVCLESHISSSQPTSQSVKLQKFINLIIKHYPSFLDGSWLLSRQFLFQLLSLSFLFLLLPLGRFQFTGLINLKLHPSIITFLMLFWLPRAKICQSNFSSVSVEVLCLIM